MATLTKERVKNKLPNLVMHPNGLSAKGVANNGTGANEIPLDSWIDPFPYGWRTIPHTLPDGSVEYIDIALSQDDFLDPQVGDRMPQSDPHFRTVNSLFDRFHNRYLDDPTTGVFADLKMLWRIPGVKEPAPDIAIIPNLRNKIADRSSFDVVEEGTRPSLVIEIISPKYPGDDTQKPKIYERAGIAEYIIINPHLEDTSKDVELIGYRLRYGEYEAMQPDSQGRLFSQSTNLWFAVDQPTRSIRLTDATTGEEFLTALQEYQARRDAEARAEQEARRAEQEAQRAEQEASHAAEERQARLAAEAELAAFRAWIAQQQAAQT